ncbi:MAG: excinuclease ABC subunit UvrB [Dysgonamonadaceae bacterium]|jgi:excinuclease ABC subunit B|nr:excinuclease ABC subunit UvrB [Dysgonamonadaceae bacterium]
MEFELKSNYKPTGDQPEAIVDLVEGVERGLPYQTLLGVTGSGKTFTIANVIEKLQKPTIVLSPNKILAAQLYSEFRGFFPNNAVEYFVSYYDYYQPEAYIPSTNTYIEKDLSINQEIDKLRLSALSALLSKRRDVIIVSSVSCIYGVSNPEYFNENVITVKRNQTVVRNIFLRRLVNSLYVRDQFDFKRGRFRVQGDTVDIFLAYNDIALRIVFWGDEIEEIYSFNPLSGKKLVDFDSFNIYPAKVFVTTPERIDSIIMKIKIEMYDRIRFFNNNLKFEEAKRLYEKVSSDIEMISELGYCSGIENYSRYFDGREQGSRPYTLLDYFPDDFLTVLDESHVTIPQLKGMYAGDNARKLNLVEYGFRLPSAVDNRPLNFEEFDSITPQKICVSATPSDFELGMCKGAVTEQLVRPTGVIDPEIEVRPVLNQIDNLIEEIRVRTERKERTLVTTLTKRMAEELNSYFSQINIQTAYIHSDVGILERIEIMEKLHKGVFDVLVGVNLLREGLDLPEVSLVAIIDADKEGFLRSYRSLTQTAGRAARNINGKVIFYADNITESIKRTIEDTQYRREKQIKYNIDHGITPQQIIRNIQANSPLNVNDTELPYKEKEIKKIEIASDPVLQNMTKEEMEVSLANSKKLMLDAAKNLDFLLAAYYRDEMKRIEALLSLM